MWLMEAGQHGGGGSPRVPRYGSADGGCSGDYAGMAKVVNKMEKLIAAL